MTGPRPPNSGRQRIPERSGTCTHDAGSRGVHAGAMTLGRGATGTACGVAAVAALMAVAAVVLHGMNRAVDTAGLNTELWTATVLQTLTWAAAGALIVTKRPRNPFGWLFCGASLAAAVTTLGNEYAVYVLLATAANSPAASWCCGWPTGPGCSTSASSRWCCCSSRTANCCPADGHRRSCGRGGSVGTAGRAGVAPGQLAGDGSLATVNNLVALQRSGRGADQRRASSARRYWTWRSR